MLVIQEDLEIAKGFIAQGAQRLEDKTGVDVDGIALQVGTGISESAIYVGGAIAQGASIAGEEISKDANIVYENIPERSEEFQTKIEACQCWIHTIWEKICMCAKWISDTLHLPEWAELICD